jgi:threonine/homoserine/homoserine lactone efflux protein
MTHPTAIGTILGLSAGLAPGPLLAFVIYQTLRYNAGEGLKVALAPLVTDLPIVLATLFVLTRLSGFTMVLAVISCSGGLFLLYLAYETVRTKPLEVEVMDARPQSLLKGAIINALNPHPYLFWLSVGAPTMMKAQAENPWGGAGFLVSFYLFLIGSKVGLALIVGKWRMFLAGRAYLYIMRVLGAALFILALVLFRDGLRLAGISI